MLVVAGSPNLNHRLRIYTKGSAVSNQSASHKDQVRSQFGATAAGYVSSPTHSTGSDLDRLVELTEPTYDDVALDVATGGGHTARSLAPHVKHVVASDLTPQMLQAAEEHMRSRDIENVFFELADAEDMPFDDDSFDIVTCRIAPHHFSDIQAFANEVARVLKSGGRFVLMDSLGPDDPELDAFINEFERRRDPTHVRSYRLQEWQAVLEKAGLVVDHHEIVIRSHDYPQWTARSGMTDDERAALDQFVLDQSAETRDFFGFEIVDGQILSFIDHKVLLRARPSAEVEPA